MSGGSSRHPWLREFTSCFPLQQLQPRFVRVLEQYAAVTLPFCSSFVKDPGSSMVKHTIQRSFFSLGIIILEDFYFEICFESSFAVVVYLPITLNTLLLLLLVLLQISLGCCAALRYPQPGLVLGASTPSLTRRSALVSSAAKHFCRYRKEKITHLK